MEPSSSKEPTPPLGPERDLILSHLLPPAPPLPQHALSRTFIDRLTFLPPDADDLDAHLSPFTMAKNALNPNALHVALEQLTNGVKVNDTEYAHDGEMTIARARLQPEFGYGGDVEAYFEHEDDSAGGRGWVYRGAALGEAHVGSAWDWKPRVDDVKPYHEEVEDYWAGFTPPAERAQLPADEDDYWAQYGAGEHVEHVEPDADSHPHVEDSPATPPSATLPTPPAETGALPDPAAALSLLLTGLGASTPKSPSDSVLEQKVRAKVRAQLMRAWSEYAAEQDAESCAFEWLRAARAVDERPAWGAPQQLGALDTRAAVVHARIEAAKDMYDVLSTDGFFRLCEEAIRGRAPAAEGEEQEFEYES